MLREVFLVLFLPCAGMSAVLIVYLSLIWCFATNSRVGGQSNSEFSPAVKPVNGRALTAAELEKLPRVTGKDLVLGTECAVCLDEIESDQPARLVPGCNHGFHLQCADAWLSRHPLCPVCRAKLGPDFFNPSDIQSPC